MRILEWVAISYFRDLPNPGIEPTSPSLGGRFLTISPPGKPSMEDVRGYMRLMNFNGSARDGKKKSDLGSKRPEFSHLPSATVSLCDLASQMMLPEVPALPL